MLVTQDPLRTSDRLDGERGEAGAIQFKLRKRPSVVDKRQCPPKLGLNICVVSQMRSISGSEDAFREFWYPVWHRDSPVTQPMKVEACGYPFVIFGFENSLGVVPARCPHRGADLSKGKVDKRGLTCPYHGLLFDYSGMCVGQEDTDITPAVSSPIKIAFDSLFVWAAIGPTRCSPPKLERFVDLSRRCFVSGPIEWNASAPQIADVTMPLTSLTADFEEDERTRKEEQSFPDDQESRAQRARTRAEYLMPPSYFNQETLAPKEPPNLRTDFNDVTERGVSYLLYGIGPDERMGWSDFRRSIYTEKVFWWYAYVNDLINKGKITHGWSVTPFCDVIRPRSRRRGAVINLVATDLSELNELYRTNPLIEEAEFLSIALKPIAKQRTDDVRFADSFK
jgi:nitrite reductase/ring-hydroxylating ferredoxin subunit